MVAHLYSNDPQILWKNVAALEHGSWCWIRSHQIIGGLINDAPIIYTGKVGTPERSYYQ